jgi:hypothetical protein
MFLLDIYLGYIIYRENKGGSPWNKKEMIIILIKMLLP